MAGVITEVNSLVDLIARAAEFAGRVSSGYYRASRELEAFPELVSALRAKQEEWEALLKKYGMSGDEFARAELDAAARILDREESRIEGIQQERWCFCGKREFRHKLFFPADLDISIKRVSDAFDGLHQKMKERDDLNDLFQKVLLQNPATLPFGHDKKYVPLENTISRVHQGLTGADGPRVVTLHGSPGTGKSTLVRYMALCYQDQALSFKAKDQALSVENGRRSRPPGERAKTPSFADGVFFVACGAGAEVRPKLAELLQNLGSKIHIEEDPNQESRDQQQGAASYQSETILHKKLHARLAEQSVLIILDDVWDSRVIQSLLVPGKGVKYLITTQRVGLWGDSVRISIETPGLEAARMILLNHVVGLQTVGDLPIQVQGIADDIISASESNPLILANLALSINGQRATDAGEWELKRNALLDFLEVQGDDEGPVRFDVKYPRSVAASMMVAVNSLEPEAKAVLYLASLCEGPSVPENVVRVFFKSVYGRLSNFVKWADYLEDHSLIRIQTRTEPGPVYCRSWSIHGTRKHFILKERAEVMKTISNMLKGSYNSFGHGTDADLVMALCYVYVEKSLMQEFTQKYGWSMSPTDSVWLKPSIEHLVWLLQMQAGREDYWQLEAHEHARKVILRYVGEGGLDDSSISSLLELPQTASATCWALQAMALTQEQPLLISGSKLTLRSLLKLLAEGEGGNPTTQRRATEALGALAEKNHRFILSHPSVLKTFLMLLSRNSSPVLQEGAAWALGTLAGSSQESRDILGGYPGLVATLVELQSKYNDVHFRVRRSASYALIQLTTELRSSRPVLEALVELLVCDVSLGVQEEAAKCVARLAGVRENQVVIAAHPHALQRLFGMLLRTTTPETKTYACMCLAELSLGPESRMAIKAFPKSMTVLEELLAEDVRETLQTLAAMCLASLHHTEYVMSLTEPLRESLSSTAKLLMSDEEPDDNIYFSLREERDREKTLENHRKLHMQPWPE